MNHKIIEKEIGWDEFITFLFTATVLQYEGYCLEINRVRLEKDSIIIYNGPYTWALLRKEDNQTIKYGFGSFYFNRRDYDQEEVGEGEDGYPILENLPTYKLVEKEILLHQLKLYE
jgi:hypothetical protein